MNRPVRIAILDSGVHLNHPHVGGVIDGKDCTEVVDEGLSFPECCLDRLGHGTAVAALIHHLAPQAELLIVRIFHRKLSTSLPIVLRAIEWSLEQKIDLLNLSFGTANVAHRKAFEGILQEALARKVLVVSPCESDGTGVFPGSLEETIGVMADPECPEGKYRLFQDAQRIRYAAAPYPRPIPFVRREDNFKGVSFATASMTGQIAQLWQSLGQQENWPAVLQQHAFRD